LSALVVRYKPARVPRLDLLIAHNLGLSRGVVTRLCRARRVAAPDGTPLTDPGLQVAPSELPRDVTIDARLHTLHVRYHLLQHKPVGFVTALRDDRHATAYELLREAPLQRDLRAVGRLDLETSGLLLWTTEGTLLHKITHPRYAVPRVYQAALSGPWRAPPPDFALEDGHRPEILELRSLAADEVHPGLHVPAGATLASITITGGKFHEVRRIFVALGAEVVGLCRVAYGPLVLPRDLPAGRHVAVDLHAVFSGLHPRPRQAGESAEEAVEVAD
jgi:16S rRNA pseudouridine516 synthase